MSDFEVAINILRQYEIQARARYLISDCPHSTRTMEGMEEAITLLENSTELDVRDLDEVGREAAKEATEEYGEGERVITWNAAIKDFEGDTI